VSRRGLLLTLACLFVVLVSARSADACSCVGPEAPCAAFGSASAVFVGTVTDARTRKFERKEKDEIDWTPVVFKFSVSQAFSGVEGAEVALPSRRAESVVEGLVVWDDGRPVEKAYVSFRDVTYHDPGMDNGAPQADEQGRFTIKGYQGQVFLISVRSDRQFVGDLRLDGPLERSEPVRVTLNAPVEPLRIVITKLR
jgi:hypothetical protein